MNTKITLKTLALLIASCNLYQADLFAGPKKKPHNNEINKKKNEDLDQIFKDFEKKNNEEVKQKEKEEKEKLEKVEQAKQLEKLDKLIRLKTKNEFERNTIKKILSNKNLDITIKDDLDLTLLWTALVSNDKETALEIIKHPKFDPNVKEKYGFTSMRYCLEFNYPEVILALLNHKKLDASIPCEKGDTPLMKAIGSKQTKIALMILNHPTSNPNVQNLKKFTPLMLAMQHDQNEIIQALINHEKFDPNTKIAGGETQLICAITNRKDSAALELLKHKDIDLTITSDRAYNAFIAALAKDNTTIALKIIEHEQFDPNILFRNEVTLLTAAIHFNRVEVVLKLLKHPKLTLNLLDNKGNPAILYALRTNEDIALEMIRHKAFKPNIPNNKGFTPLMIALCFNRTKIALELLTNFKLELDLKNIYGSTALDMAFSLKNYAVIDKMRSIQEEIENKKNNSYKATPDSDYPFNESETLKNVTDWYSNSEQAYKKHVKKYKKSESDKDYQLMVRYHTFSEIVDLFIKALAIKGDLKKEDSLSEGCISYNIPGQIIYESKDDNGKKVKINGVFSYGINKNKQLFHRCFSARIYDFDDITIKNVLEKKIEICKTPEDNFTIETPLKEIKKTLTLKPILFNDKEIARENAYYVEIYDKNNGMTIRLFKTV